MDALDTEAIRWFSDAVFYMYNGALGGSMTMAAPSLDISTGNLAWTNTYALLVGVGIDPTDLLAYFSIEEDEPTQ